MTRSESATERTFPLFSAHNTAPRCRKLRDRVLSRESPRCARRDGDERRAPGSCATMPRLAGDVVAAPMASDPTRPSGRWQPRRPPVLLHQFASGQLGAGSAARQGTSSAPVQGWAPVPARWRRRWPGVHLDRLRRRAAPTARSCSRRRRWPAPAASPMTSGPCSPTSVRWSPGPTWPCAIWRCPCHVTGRRSRPGPLQRARRAGRGAALGRLRRLLHRLEPLHGPGIAGDRGHLGCHGRGRPASRRHGPQCPRSRPEHHRRRPRAPRGDAQLHLWAEQRAASVQSAVAGQADRSPPHPHRRAGRPAAGAQFVVVLLHWGQENQVGPDPVRSASWPSGCWPRPRSTSSSAITSMWCSRSSGSGASGSPMAWATPCPTRRRPAVPPAPRTACWSR